MKFQKTTEYALQIMAFLSRAKDRPVASSELHRHLSIPRKYLQRLLTRLSKQGLIHSTRGRKGGYSLARTPRQISLLQIVKTVEGFDDSLRCFFGFGTCSLNNPWALHDHWAAQRRSLLQVLSSTRLSDLAAETPIAQLPGLTLALRSPIL